MAKLLQQLGIQIDGKHHLNIVDEWAHLLETQGLKATVIEEAKDHMWTNKIIANARHDYQGLLNGRDNKLSDNWSSTLQNKEKHQWNLLQGDGVSTPAEERHKTKLLTL